MKTWYTRCWHSQICYLVHAAFTDVIALAYRRMPGNYLAERGCLSRIWEREGDSWGGPRAFGGRAGNWEQTCPSRTLGVEHLMQAMHRQMDTAAVSLPQTHPQTRPNQAQTCSALWLSPLAATVTPFPCRGIADRAVEGCSMAARRQRALGDANPLERCGHYSWIYEIAAAKRHI